MGKAQLDPAHLVQPAQVLLLQGELQAGQVFPGLRLGTRADDGDDLSALLPRPVQRHLRGAAADLRGHVGHGRRDLQRALAGTRRVGVDDVAHGAGRGVGVRRRVILAAQDPAPDHAPGGHRQAQRTGHRQQLALHRALDQAVLDLQAHEARPAAQVGQHVGLGDDPGGGVGDAEVEQLARAHQIVQGPHDLLDGRGVVPLVQPVQIDVVRLQPAQAGLHRLDEVLAMVAGGVGVVEAHAEREFGGQYEALALSGDEFAGPSLGGALGVMVCRVDEVASGLHEGAKHALAIALGGAPALLLAEHRGAQAQLGDPQAARAEQFVAHRHRSSPMAQVTFPVPVLRCSGASVASLGHRAGVVQRPATGLPARLSPLCPLAPTARG